MIGTIKKSATPSMSSGSFMSYSFGYGASILLTVVAFYLVSHHVFSSNGNIYGIACLAGLQAVIQLRIFLHLGHDKDNHWGGYAFIAMLLVVAILVGGSLWIMRNLNYHMTPSSHQTNQYMHNQDGI